MAAFYGLTIDDSDPDDVGFARAKHFSERRSHWLTPGNHNYLRLPHPKLPTESFAHVTNRPNRTAVSPFFGRRVGMMSTQSS